MATTKPYHHGNLRRALIDEAVATIRAEGVGAVTLRDIGARVGVSRTALYRHFADKGALLAAVATEGFRALREQLVAACEGGRRGRAGFEAMGSAYIRFAMENPAHYRVMFSGALVDKARDVELTTQAEAAFGTLVEALTELSGGEDVVLRARFVWAVVHGVAMLGIEGQVAGAGEMETLARYAVERVAAGMEAGARG